MISLKRIEEICEKYYDDIYNYCFVQMKNRADSMDITQEVFLLLIKKRNSLTDCNIKAWLYDVALNFSRKKKAAENKCQVLSFNSEADLPMIENGGGFTCCDEFFSEMSEEDVLRQKEKILSSLTEDERVLYEDVYVRKKTSQQISEEYGISLEAVNKRRCRLKDKIKRKIQGSLLTMILLFIKIFM